MPAERRRVLLLAPSFAGGAGGAERVFSLLAKHLDRSRFEIHVALAQGQHSHLRDLPSDVVVHDLQLSRMRYALPAIVKLARRVKPDVILSTVVYLNAMLLLARDFLPKTVRIIVREATTPSMFLSQETPHPRLWNRVYRHLYPRADKIICLSDAMVTELTDLFGVPSNKLVRIYNPVDVDSIRQTAAAGANPYSGEGPHLVCVGRLQKPKGVDVLLQAMPLLRNQLAHATLTIVGEGPLESALKSLTKTLRIDDSVTFVGFQQNPWRYIKHADVFVLPSRFEGMPNTLLEAIALGTRSVATDCPGGVREVKAQFPEIVLVAPENPDALATAIVDTYRSKPSCSHTDFGSFALGSVITSYSELLN